MLSYTFNVFLLDTIKKFISRLLKLLSRDDN